MKLRIAVLLAAALATPASARFLESDADRIDEEDRMHEENYNDKASYRYPVSWDRLWVDHDVGWRANAGSLSINRFDYREDIKLVASEGDVPFELGYVQTRRDDMIDQRLERELRVSYIGLAPFLATFLGDGNSHKEYGDMGAALAWRPGNGNFVEAYYWDPDLYFETKKSYSDDQILHRTHTTGLRGSWDLGILRASWEVSHDSPLLWSRPSHGYSYAFERRLIEWRLEGGGQQGWSGYLCGIHEGKREMKLWSVPVPAIYRKSMRRRSDNIEAGVVQSKSGEDIAVTVQMVQRDAHYEFEDIAMLGNGDYEEPPGRERSHWNDHGLYVTDHFPLEGVGGRAKHFFQLGLYSNYVTVPERKNTPWFEVKLQTAYDIRIGSHGGMFLNATWDLDQFTRSYQKQWGGGSLAFFLLF